MTTETETGLIEDCLNIVAAAARMDEFERLCQQAIDDYYDECPARAEFLGFRHSRDIRAEWEAYAANLRWTMLERAHLPNMWLPLSLKMIDHHLPPRPIGFGGC